MAFFQILGRRKDLIRHTISFLLLRGVLFLSKIILYWFFRDDPVNNCSFCVISTTDRRKLRKKLRKNYGVFFIDRTGLTSRSFKGSFNKRIYLESLKVPSICPVSNFNGFPFLCRISDQILKRMRARTHPGNLTHPRTHPTGKNSQKLLNRHRNLLRQTLRCVKS